MISGAIRIRNVGFWVSMRKNFNGIHQRYRRFIDNIEIPCINFNFLLKMWDYLFISTLRHDLFLKFYRIFFLNMATTFSNVYCSSQNFSLLTVFFSRSGEHPYMHSGKLSSIINLVSPSIKISGIAPPGIARIGVSQALNYRIYNFCEQSLTRGFFWVKQIFEMVLENIFMFYNHF